MPQIDLWFESGESTFSVRGFEIEERMNGLFTAAGNAMNATCATVLVR
jgi:hypothetical protein